MLEVKMEDVIKLDRQIKGYTAVYQTPQTIQLDEIFGLTGHPISEGRIGKIQALALRAEITQVEMCMPYFIKIAGDVGNFVGFPFDEIGVASDRLVRVPDLGECVRKGYLEQFNHEGVEVVAPTTKYGKLLR